MLKIPRFFHFELLIDGENGTDYRTTQMMEDATYITISAYWDDLMVTGFAPIFVLTYLNLQIYLRVRFNITKRLIYEKREIIIY